MHLHHPQHPQTSTIKSNPKETQAIKINISTNHTLTISNNYIPPRNPSTNTQSVDYAITDLLTHLTDTPNSVITGDFNAHSNQWHSTITDHRGDHIASIIQSSSHSMLNRNSYTRLPPNQNQQPTSPDITTISSNLLNKTQWETKTALHSDHLPILITITITENFRLQQTPNTFTNYKKANWTGFKEEIEQALSNTPAPDNVHTSNKLLTNLILTADKHHIPKGQVKTRNSILPAPIRDLIKTRNNLRRTKPTDPNRKLLNNDITKRINDHKTNLWKDKLEQNWDHKQNTHTYWNRLNNKKSPEQTNKNIYFNNKPARTPIQKATAFNKQFANTVKHATKRTNRKVNN